MRRVLNLNPFSAAPRAVATVAALGDDPFEPHDARPPEHNGAVHVLDVLAQPDAGRYEEAITWAEAALRERPTYMASIRELAAASALAGRLSDAQKAMARSRQLDPQGGFPRSKIGSRFADPRILRGCKKVCDRLACQNE